ncbi:hypothetical protein DLH72_04550 [Candidatus Gracilibacteria bacterium]|nr:MAG: hypothetical protein DLH72_04550 [Candidatus Gracilibacteria bacterium]
MILDKLHHEKFENREGFNEFLIYGNRNEELVEYIKMVLKDYERVGCYKMLSAELITDEREIDISKYEMEKFSYKKNLKGILENTRSINDSRYNLLKVVFEISIAGNNGEIERKEKEVHLLLPKPYNKYYYLINGKKLYPIYQVVDNSTYNKDNNTTVIVKTLRSPLKIVKSNVEIEDTNKNIWNLTRYTYEISYGKKDNKINPALYYFAKDGFVEGLHYLDAGDFIRLRKYDLDYNNPELVEKYACFKLNNVMYCHVDKERLTNDPYIQAIVVMLKESITNKDNLNIFEKEHWLKKLGKLFTTSPMAENQKKKGNTSLNSFEISLDLITQEILKLKPENKADSYAILRWVLQNFNELAYKDNFDLANKRIRIAEYLAAEVVNIISTKLYGLLKCNKITMKELENALSIKPNILIFKMQESILLRYDNAVNDMTVFSALKYTTKGISTQGNKTNQIPESSRRIYPSHMGRLDVNTSSNGDPGLTGNLCPISDMKTTFFDNDVEEPENYRLELKELLYNNDDYKNPFKSDFVMDLKECFIDKNELYCTILELVKERDSLAENILSNMVEETNKLLIKSTKYNTMETLKEGFNPINDLNIIPKTVEKVKSRDILQILVKRKRNI